MRFYFPTCVETTIMWSGGRGPGLDIAPTADSGVR